MDGRLLCKYHVLIQETRPGDRSEDPGLEQQQRLLETNQEQTARPQHSLGFRTCLVDQTYDQIDQTSPK